MLVWYWYEVNHVGTLDTFTVKLMEAKSILALTPSTSTAIVIAVPIVDSLEEAQTVLLEFVSGFYPVYNACERRDSRTDCRAKRDRGDT